VKVEGWTELEIKIDSTQQAYWPGKIVPQLQKPGRRKAASVVVQRSLTHDPEFHDVRGVT